MKHNKVYSTSKKYNIDPQLINQMMNINGMLFTKVIEFKIIIQFKSYLSSY